jgi:hypothetical protein
MNVQLDQTKEYIDDKLAVIHGVGKRRRAWREGWVGGAVEGAARGRGGGAVDRSMLLPVRVLGESGGSLVDDVCMYACMHACMHACLERVKGCWRILHRVCVVSVWP